MPGFYQQAMSDFETASCNLHLEMVASALEANQLKHVTTLHKDAINAIQALLDQKNVSGHEALAKLVHHHLN